MRRANGRSLHPRKRLAVVGAGAHLVHDQRDEALAVGPAGADARRIEAVDADDLPQRQEVERGQVSAQMGFTAFAQ